MVNQVFAMQTFKHFTNQILEKFARNLSSKWLQVPYYCTAKFGQLSYIILLFICQRDCQILMSESVPIFKYRDIASGEKKLLYLSFILLSTKLI